MKINVWIWFLCLALYGCHAVLGESQTDVNIEWSKRQRVRSFRQADTILVVADSSVQHPRFNNNEGFKLIYVDPYTSDTNLLGRYHLWVIGDPQKNMLLQQVFKANAIQFQKNRIDFQGEAEFQADAIFVQDLPNPWSQQHLVQVLTGNDQQMLQTFVNQRSVQNGFGWGSRMDVQGFVKGQLVFSAGFKPDSWRLDPDLIFNYLQVQDTAYRSDWMLVRSKSSQPIPEFMFSELKVIERRLEKSFSDKPDQPVSVWLYANLEEKGFAIRSTKPAEIYEGGVHLIVDPAFKKEWGHILMGALVSATLPEELPEAWLPAVGMQLLDDWRGKAWPLLAKKWALAGQWPAYEAFDQAAFVEHYSPYGMELVRASILKTWLAEEGGWKNLSQRLEQLSKSDLNTARELAMTFSGTSTPIEQIPDRLLGFNFAHEGYRIYNGYGGQQSDAALSELALWGSNALALIPYSFLRASDVPADLPLMQRAGSETDESLVRSIYQARQLDLNVMLKPQIWMPGGWPGEIGFQSEADWTEFFTAYERWIMHFALLSEVYNIPLLCAGTELVKTTLQKPESWRSMLGRMRALYSGQITYAANWGEEIDQIALWDAVDVMGVNCYYPLSTSKTASKKELQAGFTANMDHLKTLSKKYERPLMITEIGFRAVEKPWIKPFAGINGRPFSGTDQAMCYEIVIETLRKEDWWSGILWWKFPSYLDYGSDDYGGFSPVNRPAAELVQAWFGSFPKN